MTTHLQSTIEAHLGWTWRDALGDAVVVDSNRLAYRRDLPDGDVLGKADAIWHSHGNVLAAGENLLLQLDALEQSLFGATFPIALDRVKAILITNRNSAGAACLSVGGAVADEWSEPFGMFGDTVKVMPGSPLLLANVLDGWPVLPSAATLQITATDGEVAFDIAILGTLQKTPPTSGVG